MKSALGRQMLRLILLAFALGVTNAWAEEPDDTRSVVIKLFVRSGTPASDQASAAAREFADERQGLVVEQRNVTTERSALNELWRYTRRHGLEQARVPTTIVAQQIIVGISDATQYRNDLQDALTISVYTRPGCKRCKAAKEFLENFRRRWPALRVEYFDVINDATARREAQQLCKNYNVRVPSFPCIHVGGKLIVGFLAGKTDQAIEAVFANDQLRQPKLAARTLGLHHGEHTSNVATMAGFVWYADPQTSDDVPLPDPDPQLDLESDPVGEPESVAVDAPATTTDESSTSTVHKMNDESEVIDLPVFGTLRVSDVGMPVFTLVIGLVDGFNPCAMWILVFLLSILVHIKERKKIIVIAGTFVIISGMVYFAFMAAWFSVFQLIGLLRPIQLGLGLLAIFIGLINVKDFFAFHKGITLSIPESAKPGLYRRVREIVAAKEISTALLGAAALAIVVNMVELLCTAGLPALYTEILTMQNLPTWTEYSYLALYIAAYMFDDAVMVTIAVVTLSNRKLQESEGRWLKLLSGSVILLLGVTMVFWPDRLT